MFSLYYRQVISNSREANFHEIFFSFGLRIPQQLSREPPPHLYIWFIGSLPWFHDCFSVNIFQAKSNYQPMLSWKSIQVALMTNVIFGGIIFHVFIIAIETRYLITTLRLQHCSIYLIQAYYCYCEAAI